MCAATSPRTRAVPPRHPHRSKTRTHPCHPLTDHPGAGPRPPSPWPSARACWPPRPPLRRPPTRPGPPPTTPSTRTTSPPERSPTAPATAARRAWSTAPPPSPSAGADGGKALALPGGASTSDGAYVRLPREVLGDATDLTVSARVKWSGDKRHPGSAIFDLGTDTHEVPLHHPVQQRRAAADLRDHRRGRRGGAGSVVRDASRGRVADVTVTLDTAAGRVTTYLDGVAVSSAATDRQGEGAAGQFGHDGRLHRQVLLRGPAAQGRDRRLHRVARGAQSPSRWRTRSADSCRPSRSSRRRPSRSVRRRVPPRPSPPTVRSSFSDGYDRDAPITWDAVPSDKYAQPGTFTVAGTAAGRAVKATVTVVREGAAHRRPRLGHRRVPRRRLRHPLRRVRTGRPHQQPHRGHGPAHGLHQGAGRPAASGRRRAGRGQAAGRLHRR